MSLLLYINGQLADLEPGQVIAQTKQVNDLNSLDNRQTNYTNKFKLPKTATNLKVMQYLTVTGNTSGIPYQENECSLYSHSGECFVYKGCAVISDGGDSFEAVIYDGIVSLYKAIENKNLSNLDLSAVQHSKDIATITTSWQVAGSYNNPEFLYILADYNGNTGLTNAVNTNEGEQTVPQVNIDYLTPSINVKWLWNKIFETYNGGVLPTGSVFDTQNFANLWMTFPKATGTTGENNVTIFHSNDYFFSSPTVNSYYYAKYVTSDLNDLQQVQDNIHMKVAQAATYKIFIKGTLFGKGLFDDPKNAMMKICTNNENLDPNSTSWGNPVFQDGYFVLGDDAYNILQGQEFTLESEPFQLEANQSISIMISRGLDEDGGFLLDQSDENTLEVTFQRVDASVINFAEAFTDFPIKDFLNEVVHRFGLTMFKDKYSNAMEFLTLQEQLQTSQVVNWSKKLIKKISEKYAYSSYAQQNWFRYNYNDKEATHYDSYINVNNINLPATRDVIKSRIYGPERVKSSYINKLSHVYKLWEKEIVENPEENEEPVKYKPLDKRYYFLRPEMESKAVNIYSAELGTSLAVNHYYRESQYRLAFNHIIADYYTPLTAILNNAVVIETELWLNDTDMAEFDFRKLVYIEQLSNYYLVNKINNYVPGKPTKCELVRVLHTMPLPPVPLFTLTNITLTDTNAVRIDFSRNVEGIAGMLEISSDNELWVNLSLLSESPFITYTLDPGDYYFRISFIEPSNVLFITVP